jgi:hypothetical protein
MTILSKLGLKSIQELSDDELRQLVSLDRQNRAMTRAAGRIKRIKKDEAAPKTHRVVTLESTGLAAPLIASLRQKNPGKTDGELIAILKSRGII